MQADRKPVADYERAIWRLVEKQVSENHSEAELAIAVELVADIYWVSDAKVRHDIQRGARSLGFVSVDAPASETEVA